ncbi:MAG: MFS transporter [Rhodospirillaceae bacterium]|nr:MFS transporter [Rhodospirillaceae bacterium]
MAQIGAYSIPALLPSFIDEWSMTNTEAGWVVGMFYAGYTLSVPVLVSLTDRVDPKRIYLFGVGMTTFSALGYALLADGFWWAVAFRTLWGIGWAGTYMPGLKALSDFIEGPGQSRAVAAHAASVGISGAASFLIAGTVAEWFGWRWGVALGGLGAGLAFVLMALFLPARAPVPAPVAAGAPKTALLDFRPVLRNRSALAYSLGYCVHTWEMNALRAWVVVFLTFVAANQGVGNQGGAGEGWVSQWLTPTAVATVMGLLGVWASVSGNELARRFGRRRYIFLVMVLSMAVAAVIGFASAISYTIAAVLVLVYATLIWADSSSLTAGAVGSALPGQRGATMAVHSTLGYAGGFVGPLAVGMILDMAGGASSFAWGLAFLHIAIIMSVGPIALWLFKPADLDGDRGVNKTRD